MQPLLASDTDVAPERGYLRNRVLLVLVLIALAGGFGLSFLTHAPNRLISGRPVAWSAILADGRFLCLLPGLALLIGPFLRQIRTNHILIALIGAAFAALLFWLAGDAASRLADPASTSARTSFGGAFWVIEAITALAIADALQRAGFGPATRIGISLILVVPIALVLVSGSADQLSIMKEYATRRDVFGAAVVTHIQIVAMTLVPTLLIGVPLGILAFRRPSLRGPLFAVLNIIQTIPSIALFGLLIAPLAGLVATFPVLSQFGISGIGVAPAVIALTLYSLLPIVRNTSAGLEQVPGAVIDAASGMGLTPSQIFRSVEIPLALPVFLAGLRVTIVQAVGLTAVAALIGAGGLGAIIFQGLGSSALDLVLLGVVPLIALAVIVDASLKLVISILKGRAA
ncbi:ABC transporter permease [Kaistia dalseonensis]|uniref:Osmoprotectant transport system permease protein n=1 Tax=Kaistia dalseonensis TaxID=410840 RepID=A0ABU0H8X5_9HYPH|nr:ABC transporter permease [Kaistia dalseonensis]MCX5495335.1 ABC transporter permease [Kaistia dalseonensis]MDQ0437921.1 osmoprotectant transport system permease protein [Kaistia dalseonensis]